MTDLDTLVRSGLAEAAGTVGAPDTDSLKTRLRDPDAISGLHDGPRRSRAVFAAAAVFLLVGASVVAVAAWPEREQQLRTGATPTTAPPSVFGGLAPGWHDLDTGPVTPDSEQRVVWTDRGLLVISGTGRTWRYEPDERRWSDAAQVPLPGGGWSVVGAVWTGEEVVAVFVDFVDSRWAAAWDSATDTWSPLGEVPVAPELAAVLGGSSLPTARTGGLLWTGERVFDMGHLVSIDRAGAGEWEPLPLPGGLAFLTSLLGTTPVFDGQEVVYVNVVGDGLAWDPGATRYRKVAPAPVAVSGAPEVAPQALATVVDGEVVVVWNPASGSDPGPGRAAAFDARSDRWRSLPAPAGVGGLLGCPIAMGAAAGVVVVERCNLPGTVALVDGRWIDNGPDALTDACCLGSLVEADGALVAWAASTDRANDPDAPYVRAKVWVPPA